MDDLGSGVVSRVALDPWEATHFRWYERLPPMVIFWRRGRRPALLGMVQKRAFERVIRGCQMRFPHNTDHLPPRVFTPR